MKTNCIINYSQRGSGDALVLPYYRSAKEKVSAAFARPACEKWAKEPIELGDFEGKVGELFVVYPKKQKEKRAILLGLGESEKLTVETLRRAYAQLVHYCHRHQIKKINIFVPKIKTLSVDAVIQGVSEGIFLSNYVFEHLKGKGSKKTSLLTHCNYIDIEPEKQKQINKWQTLCEGVSLARDLVNDNADHINAEALSQVAHDLSKKFKKIKTVVLDKKRLAEEKLNLILTVNKGANIDPALIILNYQGDTKEKQPTVIVGKGISYDTGGIQIKPSAGRIIDMKSDMSGAAAVLGVLYAAAKLDLPMNIVGVIPACENSISASSYKPGDVYESYLGKTVEIISTDAEGRLILADALAYAQNKFNPSHLIDLATLTGSVVAALGDQITGMMSNSPKLSQKIMIASEKSGENVWELPLYEEYKEGLKSSIADLKNSAGSASYPGAIVAGLFLQEFVKTTPWAHLDIAGTAYLSAPKHYHKTKATGVGVRLVIAFLEDLLGS